MNSRILGDGCTIELLGRTGLKYTEGATTLFVGGERLVGKPDYVVYANSIGPWEGYLDSSAPVVPYWEDPRRLPDAERRRVLANIESAFRANGLVLEIVESA
jgi:hypothetical protein